MTRDGSGAARAAAVNLSIASELRLRGLIALLRDDPRAQQFAETELRSFLAGDVADANVADANVAVLRERLQLWR